MKVFVLGATGAIGQSIIPELIAHDHEIVALARSDASEAKLAAKNIPVIRGDLRAPADWCKIVHEVEAIIHVAGTFSDDEGDIDRHLVSTLIAEAKSAQHKIRFIYTGGCWLFGETGDRIADEESEFDPLPAFKWVIESSRLVFDAPCFETMMIHPAMVYDRDGGTVSRFLSSARKAGRVEVWGSLQTRWPVVHGEDNAQAYRLVLERGQAGQSYCVAAETGVWVGEMAAVISQRFGLKTDPWVREVLEAVREHGEWAFGPALDQQMSANKIMRTLDWSPKFTNMLAEIG